MIWIIIIFIIVILIFLSGFFAAAEMAFVSVSRIKVRKKSKKQNKKY
jgi:CBS domain containing-hemolysin-like protein